MKNIVYCNIRVEEEPWEKLRYIADANKRSINKEIEYLIDKEIKDYEDKNGKIKVNKKNKNVSES